MTIDNRVELIELYDLYFELLTDKQKQYFEEYYFDDFSISEIAENHEISRNAVHDQLKKVIKNLEDYELKLGLLKKIKTIEQLEIDSNIKENILEIIKG
jgi:predicted DNA-binding protein YlxM (UPF0122 family)